MNSDPILIVFDCDGTLLDSQHVISEAMKFAFSSVGLGPPDRSAILRTVGLSIPEALGVLAPQQSRTIREAIAGTYREWCAVLRQQDPAHDPMFSGAVPLLYHLSARENVFLGIATGKSRRGVARFIEHHGLGRLFATIQTADDAPSKPHPAMLLQAMDETGIPPDHTVMIGDTSYDMIMAGCAGVTGIGVTWGYHSQADLQKTGATIVVHSFAALANTLENWQPAAARYEAVA